MNKLMKFLVPVVALVTVGTLAFAAPGVRGAKGKAVINFSASASEICSGHCVVYSLFISTASSNDYAILRDSNTANTSSNPSAYAVSTTTALTQVTFDPPLQFVNGVSLNCAATTPFCGATFEPGDVTSGY